MRGWTHYLSGLAMATFFPSLLADLARGVMLPVIAGVYGYLPDFVDFKFRRFLWKRDVVVDPAPQDERRRVSPRRILIKDLRREERWRLYYVEGVVARVIAASEDRLELVVSDGTGSIRVVARDEDRRRLAKAFGEIREGSRVRLPGYLEIDESGELYWNVADAPHPQYIAEAISRAIDEAYESGRMVTVKIFNIRMKGDVYRRFLVHYDSKNRRVRVLMGPLVSVGGLPFEGTDTPEYRRVGEASTKHPFRKVYPRPTVVDAFSGPEIGFERVRRGDVELVEEVFIPWHRGFSHSFTAGLLLAIPLLLLLYSIGYSSFIELTIASVLGYWMHVVEDQLGFMGSVLLPPLTRRRVPGLMLGPRMHGAMNFATAWLMMSLAIWNINRHFPAISPGAPRPIGLPDSALLLILASPSIALYVAGAIDRLRYSEVLRRMREEIEAEERLEEMEEVAGL